MKKTRILPLALGAMLLSVGMIGCGEKKQDDGPGEVNPGEEVKINITAEKKKIIKDETLQLTADVKDVTWTSTKETVATVSNTGLVTAVGKGSTTIKANKNGYLEGTITITVELEKITITAANNKNELLAEETVQLSASKDGVTWSSSDATVATVSNAGLVTAIKFGTVTIKAEKDGFDAGTISIKVNRPAAIGTLHLEDADHYSADGWWGSGSSGPGATPIYERTSGNASDGKCIAHFDEGDKETLKFTSTAAVTAEMVIKMAYSSAFEDMGAVMGIKFNNAAINITGRALDTNSSSDFIDFSLGDVNVVSGENTLEISFLAAAPYLDDVVLYSKQTATIAVKQAPAKETITVENDAVGLEAGKTAQINVTKGEGVTFTSDNTEAATVSETGLITGVSLGTANIIIKKEGMYSAKVAVTVSEALGEGEIRLEAELADEVVAGTSSFMNLKDTTSGITRAHSAGGYISGYNVSGEETLTFHFTSDTAKTMTLIIMGSAAYGSTEDYVFATQTTMKLNDVEISAGDAKIEAGDGGMSAPRQETAAGDVNIVAGENVFTITFHGKAPSLDYFRFAIKAAA